MFTGAETPCLIISGALGHPRPKWVISGAYVTYVKKKKMKTQFVVLLECIETWSGVWFNNCTVHLTLGKLIISAAKLTSLQDGSVCAFVHMCARACVC